MIVYHFDIWAVLDFAVQFILPLIVGLVTTKVTSSRDQFLLLAGLTLVASVVTSGLTAHDAGTPFDIVQAILTAVAGFLVSVGAHFGIWKPTGAAGAALNVFRKAPAPAPAVASSPAIATGPGTVAQSDAAATPPPSAPPTA